MATPGAKLRMLAEYFWQRTRSVCTDHGTGVHSVRADWLDAAVAAVKKIQISRQRWRSLVKMCFESNPFFFQWSMLRQLRPASGGVDYCAGCKCVVRGSDMKNILLLNFAHGHAFFRLDAGSARSFQQRHVELITGNAFSAG